LGYLIERYCALRLDGFHARARQAGREPAPLDPSGPRRGHVDPRWNLRLNAEIEPDL
jgi:predicted transcriptional regulator of viral defense system